jgi:hypothetical protein
MRNRVRVLWNGPTKTVVADAEAMAKVLEILELHEDASTATRTMFSIKMSTWFLSRLMSLLNRACSWCKT